MQGSQYRNADGWINDPLSGILGPFMNPSIPAGFSPQNPPYLSSVTQLTGTGFNALAAVPTVQLPIPFIVEVNIPGDARYKLIAGIFTGAGYVAPNDQAESEATWMSIS